MMKLKVNDAQLLTKSMTALAVIVDEAAFKIDEARLKLKEMDLSRVAMVDLARALSFESTRKKAKMTGLVLLASTAFSGFCSGFSP